MPSSIWHEIRGDALIDGNKRAQRVKFLRSSWQKVALAMHSLWKIHKYPVRYRLLGIISTFLNCKNIHVRPTPRDLQLHARRSPTQRVETVDSVEYTTCEQKRTERTALIRADAPHSTMEDSIHRSCLSTMRNIPQTR